MTLLAVVVPALDEAGAIESTLGAACLIVDELLRVRRSPS
jgi:hypothetical protein